MCLATLQPSLSSLYINDFNLFGRNLPRAGEGGERLSADRRTTSAELYVRGDEQSDGARVGAHDNELSQRADGDHSGSTDSRRRSSPARPEPGTSTGELLNQVDQLIQTQFVSAGLGIYSGQSYQERASSGDAALVFVLGLVMVFLVLAAQFESWSVPFAVLLGVPFGVLGALLGIWLRGTSRTTSTSRSA